MSTVVICLIVLVPFQDGLPKPPVAPVPKLYSFPKSGSDPKPFVAPADQRGVEPAKTAFDLPPDQDFEERYKRAMKKAKQRYEQRRNDPNFDPTKEKNDDDPAQALLIFVAEKVKISQADSKITTLRKRRVIALARSLSDLFEAKTSGAIGREGYVALIRMIREVSLEMVNELSECLDSDTYRLYALRLGLEVAFEMEISILDMVNGGVVQSRIAGIATADRLRVQIMVLELEESIAKKAITKSPATAESLPAVPQQLIPVILSPVQLPANCPSIVIIQPESSRRVVLFPGLFNRR